MTSSGAAAAAPSKKEEKGEPAGARWPPKVKAALERADAIAKARLSALGGVSGGRLGELTMEEVEKLLLTMGANWPTQQRPNVTEREDGSVPGMCLGLVHGLGGQGMKVSLIAEVRREHAGW